MSQLLPSLGHYLFIDSMNEVDLLEALTSLFVKSAREDFPYNSVSYCCANQSLNKFSFTDSRIQGTLGSLFARKAMTSFSSNTVLRELLGPQCCAKLC